jgi:hypothetical protein
VYCQPNSGSFYTCGSYCPSGWSAQWFGTNYSCGNFGNKDVYCRPN